ncbi:WD40 repeat-like protein [Coniochaeta hoffmannii]|uniref:WD40 repeat-like protein n=1 Tax=Coniochaeta hoffmannii TaxID=91930 RepID=A0AA38RKV7_9PEZI|nr:WD40 repeat-like protein [Coniochaeta hoffmannii]
MVKSYLKYEHSQSFGIVASSSSNIVWSGKRSAGTGAGQAIVAANEEVLCWDIKKGELFSKWRDENCRAQVTAIAQSRTDPDVFAVGYEDGSIRLWDSKISTVIVNFNGHKSAITVLVFDKTGTRLASGSKDTDVVIWDLVAEVGQYKLRGHKDQVTGVRFVEAEPRSQDGEDAEEMALDESGEGFLLTTGKDSLIKLWDLSSRHCIETHVAQTNGECWALGVSPDSSGCVTAGNDGELKVWALDTASLFSSTHQVDISNTTFLHDRGTLHRQSKDRAVEVIFHPRRDYFAVHGVEKAVEIWRIRTEAEVKKSLARKRRRRREKLATAKGGKADAEPEAADGEDDVSSADVSDVFVQHVIVRTTGKVRSVDWASSSGSKELQLLVGTTNNLLELYSIQTREKSSKTKKDDVPDYQRGVAVELPGHRTDIRAVSISSDDKMLASASNGSLKIWNIKTRACIRTFECGYALCCSFLPGDKVVVVGTKSGELELFDVASATLLESVAAHEGAIWSLQVHPDGRSVVSGSADKTAKFWDFKIVQEPVLGTTRTTPKLKLVQSRILKVADDILSLRFSPDARLLAVALLDNTVKVFFVDTLKLYLNLYGHKLPVLSMSISYDSKLIVTSSADKNIRIWGLDFGDCHKALFGHTDSILQVAFVPHNSDGNGHHFFSASKDKAIKYWDADKFEQIQRIDGHHGEVWALAVAHAGTFFVSASHDKSIRVWRETDEQIFLEEERERELEELYEQTLTTSLDADPDADAQADNEIGAATHQTTETLMAGERIAEALELSMADLNLMREHLSALAVNPNTAPPQRNPIFLALGGISAEQHVLNVLQRIKASSLHDALLVLPFSMVPLLFTFLHIFAQRSMNIPLTCRILFFMLKTHHRQIVASRTMRAMLDGIRRGLRDSLRRQKDEMGYNIAALKVVGMQIRDKNVKDYVDDKWEEEEEDKARQVKKRGFVHVA